MADVTPNLHALARAATAGAACLAVVLTASSCSSDLGPDLHPGDAVLVAGERITLDQVDSTALDVCELEKPSLAQQGFAVPMSFVRSLVAESLTTDVLLDGFAKEYDVNLPVVRRAIHKQAVETAEQVPAAVRDAAVERLQIEGVRRAVLQLAGRKGQPADAAAEQLLALGTRRFAEYRAQADVTRDPRLGDIDLDTLAYSGAIGSLSVDVDQAKGGALDQEAVGRLPADQRCGEAPETAPAPAGGQPIEPAQPGQG